MDQWEKFESEATTLETWLHSAMDRIQIITSLDDLELKSLGAIQKKMQMLVDLRQDADKQQALKTRVNSLGTQLARSRPHDSTIPARVDSIDQQWINLMYKVGCSIFFTVQCSFFFF